MKNRRYIKTFFALILLPCILLTMCFSCNVSSPYQHQQSVSSNLFGAVNNDTSTIATLPWHELFTDTILQSLITEGINNNLDLKTAIANIGIAEANFVQSKQAFYPNLSGTVSGGGFHPSDAQGKNTQVYQFYAQSSWEIDLWNKLKSSKRAMYANLLASQASKQAVQTQLIASIAATYYQLLAYDAQLDILQQSLKTYAADTLTMRILKNSDVVTGAAVVQSTANYYAALSSVPDVKYTIRLTENTLSLLLGRIPGNIVRDSLNQQNISTTLNIGVPAQLLANRPDVRAAEFQLRNCFESINIARAYFYPTLTITGETGLYETNLKSFFNAGAFFANIVGGLTQPIFNNGLNKQRLKVANINFETAKYNYSKVLLNAGQEVSNAVYQYQMAKEKKDSRQLQINNLIKSVHFTKELLKYSNTTNYTDVLTSEQNLLTAKQNAVNDKLQELQSVVKLYAALGGGWR